MSREQRASYLLVTRNLPPLLGGMERLNWHMADELARRGELRVVGPRGSASLAPNNVQVKEVPATPLPVFLMFAFVRSVVVSLCQRPSLVVAGSGLTAPVAWCAARLVGGTAAVYVHGLDLAVNHPLYRWIWGVFLRRMDRVVANSRATRQLALDLGISPDRIRIVHPGVLVPAIGFRRTHRQLERSRLGLTDNPILLSVGRLTERKGMLEFVRDVLPQIVEQKPTTTLLIVGEEPHQALFANGQSIASIKQMADSLGLLDNVICLGAIRDIKRLASIYACADVHVFPVIHREYDPEGFGMVAVEAAAHGLCTVAYSTGGVADAVSDGVSGYLVEPGRPDAFAEMVVKLLARGLPEAAMLEFARDFAWDRFGNTLWQALKA